MRTAIRNTSKSPHLGTPLRASYARQAARVLLLEKELAGNARVRELRKSEQERLAVRNQYALFSCPLAFSSGTTTTNFAFVVPKPPFIHSSHRLSVALIFISHVISLLCLLCFHRLRERKRTQIKAGQALEDFARESESHRQRRRAAEDAVFRKLFADCLSSYRVRIR